MSTGSVTLVVSERKRREAAYRDSVAAVLAYINDDDADLSNLLDEAAKTDALAVSYRLTFLVAMTVEELAAKTGETPSAILERIIRQTPY